MKKLKLFTLALLLGTAGLFASEIEKNKISNDGIRAEIVQLLKAPDFSLENELNVTLTFTFSSEGELVVLNVDSKDPNVLDYIRKNLNYQKIENSGVRDKVYTMPIKIAAK